jgi:hypothetical protein
MVSQISINCLLHYSYHICLYFSNTFGKAIEIIHFSFIVLIHLFQLS